MNVIIFTSFWKQPCFVFAWAYQEGCLKFHIKLNSYSNASVFLSLCRMRISVFWGQERLTSKAISLYELKKVQLQERYTLVTQDSIGHLKTLCMSVYNRYVVALESEWKRYSSSQSDKKPLAFEYEFSFKVCISIIKMRLIRAQTSFEAVSSDKIFLMELKEHLTSITSIFLYLILYKILN